MGILSLDSCTADVSAGPEVVRSGANHVGRSRGDASKPAVVHLTGTSRHDRARLCFICGIGTGFGRRSVAVRGDFGLARPQSPGIRGTDDGIVAARLYRRGGDPVDAHPRQGDPHRGPPAIRYRRTADAGRPVAGAAVRRAANSDFLGRRRQPAPDQRRHRAVDLAGCVAKLAAADPCLWNLAAAGTGVADGPCRRCAARGRRRLSAQPLDLERPRDRGDGPRHRRPSRCPDSRTRRACAGNSPNPTCATRRCRKKPSCCATSPPPRPGRSGPRAPRAICATPTRPMCGRPREPASPTSSTATSNCWKPTSAPT